MAVVRIAGREVVYDLVEPLNDAQRVPPLRRRLALAVVVTDALTQSTPLGALEIVLQPGALRPVINASGMPCFLDVPAGTYTLEVVGEHYLAQSMTVTLPHPTPLQPMVTTILAPLPSYPFARGCTVLRGVVTAAATGAPVRGAQVRVLESTPLTLTTAAGEFVLAWPPLTAAQVVTQRRAGINQRFVRNNSGDRTLTIEVTHPGLQTATVVLAELAEGAESSLGKIVLMAI